MPVRSVAGLAMRVYPKWGKVGTSSLLCTPLGHALFPIQSVVQGRRLRSPDRVHAVVHGRSSAAGGVSPSRRPTSRGR